MFYLAHNSAPFAGPAELVRSMKLERHWRTDYALTRQQKTYLDCYVNRPDGSTPQLVQPDDPNDPFHVLCFSAAAPVDSVQTYYRSTKEGIEAARRHQDLEAKSSGPRKKKHGVMSSGEVTGPASILAQKAREAKLELEKSWAKSLEDACGRSLTESEAEFSSIVRIQKSFMAAAGNMDEHILHKAIQKALEQGQKHTPISHPKKTPGLIISRRLAFKQRDEQIHASGSTEIPEGCEDQTVLDIRNLLSKQKPIPRKTRTEKKKEKDAAQQG